MIVDELLALIVAVRCVACRLPAAKGQLLCGQCRASLPWLTADLCLRCGLPQPCAAVGGSCPAATAAFDRAWAPLAYAGSVPNLVRALKERGSVPVAAMMAAMIVASAPPSPRAAIVVAVPADPWRSRRRGLDHAALLAGEIAARIGCEQRTILRRERGQRQAGRDRVRRLQGAAGCRATATLSGETVLLIDDVHTTGATLDRAASALRQAGAGFVQAMTFARAL